MKLLSLFSFLLFSALVSAQTITTIAGTGLAEGVNAQVAQVGSVGPVTVDGQGNVYFFDFGLARVRRVTPSGVITTIAGNGIFGFSGDGGPAIDASLGSVFGLAVDASGNIFIADSTNNRVRRVNTQGLISTVAGNGASQTQDGAVATSTGLLYPTSIVIDPSGRLVIAADDFSIHRLEGGIIRRIAGTGQIDFFNYAPDGSLAVAQRLHVIRGMTIDSTGSIYFSQNQFGRIRKLSPDGVLSTYAGNGAVGQTGDGGPALAASLTDIASLSMNAGGELFISITPSNQFVCKVRKVSPSGVISTVAGNGSCSDSPDGGAATSQALNFPRHVASDSSGNLYIAAGRLRKVDSVGQISSLAGGSPGGLAIEGEPAISAKLDVITGMVGKPTGGMVYTSANRIRELAGGAMTTLVGESGSLSTQSQAYAQLALDASGSLYATAPAEHKVYRITTSGVVSVIAGTGQFGYSGDGGPATAAMFNFPSGIVVDGSGNIFVADSNNHRIRRIDLAGVVSTIAGTGAAGFSPNGTAAASGQISNPWLLAISPAGELHFSESISRRIRKINSAGNLVTVAGTGTTGNLGDGGAATAAQIGYVNGLAFDVDGNLYLSDQTHSVVRRVSTTGIITTEAGTGVLGYMGDGGNPTLARLNSPGAIAFDAAGDLLIADNGNLRIRKLQRSLAPALPSPPVMSAAMAGDAQISVQFIASDSGSSAIIDFTATCRAASGTVYSATGPSSPILVTGLANNAGYVCTVRARNASGSSSESAGSLPAVPLSSTSYLVSVNKTGSGMSSGIITSLDGGISCGANCSVAFPAGTRVTLYALSSSGTATALTGWSGVACEEASGPACTFTVTAAVSATAQFKSMLSISGLASELIPPARFRTLPFSICAGEDAIPSGAIEVLGSIYGPNTTIQLGQDLNGNLLLDSGETLATSLLNVAIPAGACVPMLARVGSGAWASGATTKAIVSARNTLISGSAPIDARTLLNVSTLTGMIGLTISGQGRVTSTGDTGLPYECTTSCSGQLYEPGTVVLTAETPTPGWQFVGWSGVTCQSGLPAKYCSIYYSVERTTNLNVVATFEPVAYVPEVTVSVNGSGVVSSSPSGINCPDDCSEAFQPGTPVTLTANASAGHVFAGWFGGTGSATCSGTVLTCQVTVDEASSITAEFLPLVTFNVVLEGAQQVPMVSTPASGSGTVVVNPVANTLTYSFSYTGLAGGITGASFHGPAARGGTAGVKIDITGNPTSGSVSYSQVDETSIYGGFWYVNFNTSTFAGGEIRGQLDNQGAAARNLVVGKVGSGNGRISSSPAGINCGGDCSEVYAAGMVITLTAAPDLGSAFSSWTGVACNGGNNAPTCSFTLNSSLSVTAAFDTTLVVPNDFNDDAKSDLLWRNTADGSVQGWLMNGLSATHVAGLLPPGNYTVMQVADLDGNGKADTLIRRPDGLTIGWLHDGLNVVLQGVIVAGNITHMADLNGDGKADLIEGRSTGAVVGWLMNGLDFLGNNGLLAAESSGWSVSQVADLNGDGKSDLIWQHTDGSVQVSLMNGLQAIQAASFAGPGSGWSVKLTADLNGDNKADLVWQNTDGTVQAWLMDGTAISQIASFVPAGTGWSPVLAGDINGDGKADLFWEHIDGRSQTWLMNGLAVTSIASFVGPGGWRATHLRDLNGDGKMDVLWRHSDGSVQAWLMNGLTISQTASLVGPGTYEVIPPRP